MLMSMADNGISDSKSDSEEEESLLSDDDVAVNMLGDDDECIIVLKSCVAFEASIVSVCSLDDSVLVIMLSDDNDEEMFMFESIVR